MLTINSLRDFLKIIQKYESPDRLMIFFDLDLTLIHENENGDDVLMEREETQELFKYLHEKDIWYTFCTARYYDIILNNKKRKEYIDEISNNIEKLYEIFEDLDIDCKEHKGSNSDEIVLKKNNKPVGVLYKGILLGDKKGPIIKQFREKYNLEADYPQVIFIDDFDKYLQSVTQHVPGCLIIKRLS